MPLTPMNSPMLRAENDVSAGAFGGAPRSLRPGGIQTALSAPPKQLGASAFLMSSVSSVARGGPSRAQSEASGLMKALRSSAELLPSERPTRGLARGTSDVAGLLKQGSGDLGRSRTVHFATGKSEGPPPNVGPSYGEVSPRVKGDEAAETIDSVWKRLNHSLPPKVSPGVSAIRSVSGRRVRLSFEEPEDEKAELSDDKIVALEEAEGFVFDAHASHAR